MSCNIIFVRHGQSMGNKDRVYCGHTNIQLSELGTTQATITAEFLKGRKIDAIYSSDLSRAYNTAVALSKVKGIKIIKNKNLREIFAGDWENKPIELLLKEYSNSYGIWLNNIGVSRPDNGESVKELQERIVKEIIKLAQLNNNKTIAVFTHATPIRTFFAFVRGIKDFEIKDIPWVTNASVSEVLYDDGVFTEIGYGTDNFMGDFSSGFAKGI